MRWIFALIITVVSVAAIAQENLSTEELTLLTFIDNPELGSQDPEQRIELRDGAQRIVGYAWRMAPAIERPGLRHAIFAPGFDTQPTENPAAAGTVRSYLELAKQLSVGWEYSGRNFPMELIQDRGSIVWLVDYLDRRGAVEENSKAIQALLQSNDFLADVGANNSILYGYSMGGLIGAFYP